MLRMMLEGLAADHKAKTAAHGAQQHARYPDEVVADILKLNPPDVAAAPAAASDAASDAAGDAAGDAAMMQQLVMQQQVMQLTVYLITQIVNGLAQQLVLQQISAASDAASAAGSAADSAAASAATEEARAAANAATQEAKIQQILAEDLGRLRDGGTPVKREAVRAALEQTNWDVRRAIDGGWICFDWEDSDSDCG